jgi:hypothetical protein
MTRNCSWYSWRRPRPTRSKSNWPSGYQAQVQAQEKDDALLTIQRVTQQPQCPNYFHYLEAQLLTDQQAWSQAWQAWRRFGEN